MMLFCNLFIKQPSYNAAEIFLEFWICGR